MIRFTQAIAGVMLCTLGSGVVGGAVGAAVGYVAPTFVAWLHSPFAGHLPADFNPARFGLGLGLVSGLFLGAGAGVFLAVVFVIRDAWLATRGIPAGSKKIPVDEV